MNEVSGEVFDLGYRHYDGPREGRHRARIALWKNGVRTTLGLGRGSLAKVLPALLFLFALVPAAAMAIGEYSADSASPTVHTDYYQLEALVLFVFSALMLFGFQTKLEKNLFLMLIAVSGIGPKLAANILSGIGPRELLEAMAKGDAIRLQAIPGVGKKTAERIALELKDRAQKTIGREDIPPLPTLEGKEKGIVEDALSALLNLGYTPKAAKTAVEKARSKITEMSLEGLIREALKVLA